MEEKSIIRTLRENSGLSIVGQSHKLDVNPNTLGAVERRRLTASNGLRRKLIDYFGRSDDELWEPDGRARVAS